MTMPTPEISSVAAPHIPMASPRRAPVNTFVMMAIDAGMHRAEPAPARAIPAISTPVSGATAATTEPPAKTPTPPSIRRRRPKMSATRPEAISMAVNGMKKAVTVHWSSAMDASNSRWIVGRATTMAAVGSWAIPAAATVAAMVLQ